MEGAEGRPRAEAVDLGRVSADARGPGTVWTQREGRDLNANLVRFPRGRGRRGSRKRGGGRSLCRRVGLRDGRGGWPGAHPWGRGPHPRPQRSPARHPERVRRLLLPHRAQEKGAGAPPRRSEESERVRRHRGDDSGPVQGRGVVADVVLHEGRDRVVRVVVALAAVECQRLPRDGAGLLQRFRA